MSPKEEGNLSVSIENSQFTSLVEAIDKMIKVIAATQIKPDRGTERNARFLKVFGLSETEIADLLGVTQPAVSKALSKGKKASKGQKKSDDTITKA